MTKQNYIVPPAWEEIPIDFRKDEDLKGMKTGVYEERFGRRYVYVSPAIYTLLESDKDLVFPRLMVSKNGKMVSIMDIGE